MPSRRHTRGVILMTYAMGHTHGIHQACRSMVYAHSTSRWRLPHRSRCAWLGMRGLAPCIGEISCEISAPCCLERKHSQKSKTSKFQKLCNCSHLRYTNVLPAVARRLARASCVYWRMLTYNKCRSSIVSVVHQPCAIPRGLFARRRLAPYHNIVLTCRAV
jgi:hypothetical protein